MKLCSVVLLSVVAAFSPKLTIAQDTSLKFQKPRLVKKTELQEGRVSELFVSNNGQLVFLIRSLAKSEMWQPRTKTFVALSEDIKFFRGKIRMDGRLVIYELEKKMVVYDVQNKKVIVEGSVGSQGFKQSLFTDMGTVFGVDNREKFYKWEMKNDKYVKLGEIPSDQREVLCEYSLSTDLSTAIRIESNNRFTYVDLKSGKTAKLTEFESSNFLQNGASASEKLAILTKPEQLRFYDFEKKQIKEFMPRKPMTFGNVKVNDLGTVAVVASKLDQSSQDGYSIFDLTSRPVKMVGFIPTESRANDLKFAISSNGKFVIHNDEENESVSLWQLAK